ncbi:hypothetical protein [Streptomyces sp. NPDC001070]
MPAAGDGPGLVVRLGPRSFAARPEDLALTMWGRRLPAGRLEGGSALSRRALSEHCNLARRPGYEDMHHGCRRLDDYTMPGYPSIVVTPRCGCSCHREGAR